MEDIEPLGPVVDYTYADSIYQNKADKDVG